MELITQIPGAPAPVGPYSKAVIVPADSEFVLVSGELASVDQKTLAGMTVTEQTTQAMENIRSVLGAAGCRLADIVATTILYTDREHFGLINDAYGEAFRQEAAAVGEGSDKISYPTRASYIVGLPIQEALIEIVVTACRLKR